jgi:hypothetical protein
LQACSSHPRLRGGGTCWGQRTLRAIADELAKAGFVTGTGTPCAAAAIAKMIEAQSEIGAAVTRDQAQDDGTGSKRAKLRRILP